MKKLFLIPLAILTFVACKKEPESVQIGDYQSFGEEISAEGAINSVDLLAKYETLQPGDTLELKVNSTVKEVCKQKGCWMTLDLGGDKDATVKFKDYAFFVPKNSEESDVIVEGKAFVDVTSVEELQHLAKDGGKSEEEIAAITEPKQTYSFLAKGVLMK